MANRYSQPSTADPSRFHTSPDELRARLNDPAVRAQLRAQGLTDEDIQGFSQAYEQWINQVGLKYNWLDRHPTVAKLLMGGAAAAPLAAFAIPALAGGGGSSAGA